jgi:hypothetical protein
MVLDADLDAEGGVVGLDIDGASAKARPHDAGDHRVSGEDHPRSLTT